jgi:hypothetical protein
MPWYISLKYCRTKASILLQDAFGNGTVTLLAAVHNWVRDKRIESNYGAASGSSRWSRNLTKIFISSLARGKMLQPLPESNAFHSIHLWSTLKSVKPKN